MHANHREDMEAAFTGDIVAIVGLKHSITGDTLADPANPIVLESISFPTPVISVAVEPKTKADQDKLGTGLGKLADEDPTFVVKYDDETGQTVISGMGELHLDIIVDRLRREFGVDANVGKPQVAYRETIRKHVHKVEARFIRQTGGRGQFGHVVIDLEPTGRAADTSSSTRSSAARSRASTSRRSTRASRRRWSPASSPATRSWTSGPRSIDGSYHEVDSSEMAFKIAGSMALKEAARQADPGAARAGHGVRGDHAGGVHGRRDGRRHGAPGRIERIDDRSGQKAIRVQVPLAELFGYATDLRSRTQGRASHTPDAARGVRRGAGQHLQGDRRPGPRRVVESKRSSRWPRRSSSAPSPT